MYYPAYSYVAGSREELAILVKANSHDPIRSVERLLDTITMMYINVDVQHPGMISMQLLELISLLKIQNDKPQKLQNTENNIYSNHRHQQSKAIGNGAYRSHSKSHWPHFSSRDAILQPN
jgi:hypothetical protein